MQPVDIRDVEEKELLIIWPDEHRSLYPYKYLRLKCRCAQCVDEWNGTPLLDPKGISDGVRPVDWSRVGRYAIRFSWNDGHQTGIYSYEMLRSICPCSSCQQIESPEREV